MNSSYLSLAALCYVMKLLHQNVHMVPILHIIQQLLFSLYIQFSYSIKKSSIFEIKIYRTMNKINNVHNFVKYGPLQIFVVPNAIEYLNSLQLSTKTIISHVFKVEPIFTQNCAPFHGNFRKKKQTKSLVIQHQLYCM